MERRGLLAGWLGGNRSRRRRLPGEAVAGPAAACAGGPSGIARRSGTRAGWLWSGLNHAGHHLVGVHRLQAPQLQYDQEQAEDQRAAGVQEVLPLVSLAQSAPGVEVAICGPGVHAVERPDSRSAGRSPGGARLAGRESTWNGRAPGALVGRRAAPEATIGGLCSVPAARAGDGRRAGERIALPGGRASGREVPGRTPGAQASSSIGRAPVSKTGGWGFDSLLACHTRSERPARRASGARARRKGSGTS